MESQLKIENIKLRIELAKAKRANAQLGFQLAEIELRQGEAELQNALEKQDGADES